MILILTLVIMGIHYMASLFLAFFCLKFSVVDFNINMIKVIMGTPFNHNVVFEQHKTKIKNTYCM